MEYQWDPKRRAISVADPRLNRMFVRQGEMFATISEYATAAGMDTAEVVDLLGELLDDGTMALEVVGDEVFVHTAPNGRPAPAGCADVPPNLWERIRSMADLNLAYAVWRLIRSMERSGWKVETSRPQILFEMSAIVRAPFFGIEVGTHVVPVLPFPSVADLLGGGGLLTEYHRAGAAAVAVVCDEGELDAHTTAVRRWILSHAWPPEMSVLVLEAPRYQPVLLSPADGAVQPISVHKDLPGQE